METQAVIELKPSNLPACATLEFRVEFAVAIAALVDRVAFQHGLDGESTLRIRAALIQKIVHRVIRCTIANVRSPEVLYRVQRIAERLIYRVFVRRARAQGISPQDDVDCRTLLFIVSRSRKRSEKPGLGDVWKGLTPLERKVLRLEHLKLDPAAFSRVLGSSIEKAESLRREIHMKLHEALSGHP